jgi:sugar fermentation stimulation protein A
LIATLPRSEIMFPRGRAVMLFVIQRTDCDAFEACADLDPAYAKGLSEAAAHGVEVLSYRCTITREGVRLADRVPWRGETVLA